MWYTTLYFCITEVPSLLPMSERTWTSVYQGCIFGTQRQRRIPQSLSSFSGKIIICIQATIDSKPPKRLDSAWPFYPSAFVLSSRNRTTEVIKNRILLTLILSKKTRQTLTLLLKKKVIYSAPDEDQRVGVLWIQITLVLFSKSVTWLRIYTCRVTLGKRGRTLPH